MSNQPIDSFTLINSQKTPYIEKLHKGLTESKQVDFQTKKILEITSAIIEGRKLNIETRPCLDICDGSCGKNCKNIQ